EAEMLELVNRERAANGLEPLASDPEMTEVARRHSADMFERGYFSHNTPENKTPFDRMRAADVRFRTAGENLALAPTLSIAHTGLMNSPGHRANILEPRYGRLGIGILDGGRRGLMITQNFRN
ncbi:MAG TPA: CAP domain-containing protein, partial [Pyrinomonadaceae bacterium]